MNAKSKLSVKYAEGVIEMNTTFAKMMQNPLSEEYALLQKTRQDFPTFAIRRRQIKSNPQKDTYKGLTYTYMETYIKAHDDNNKTIMAEYEMLRGISKEAQDALAEPCSYNEMKNWFLKKYPAIADFHKMREDLLKTA